jgi:hypothetical protein
MNRHKVDHSARGYWKRNGSAIAWLILTALFIANLFYMAHVATIMKYCDPAVSPEDPPQTYTPRDWDALLKSE